MGPDKPRYLSPCNGCGLCCAVEICPVGKIAFPHASAPCPGLYWDGARTWCKLAVVECAAGMEPIIAEALGIGVGCTMDDESNSQRKIP